MPAKSLKSASSTSIIGGADGPTVIFLAGPKNKDRNIFRRMKNNWRNKRYQKKRKKAERQIVPGAHSVPETIAYIRETYGAIERDSSYPLYEERRRQMKYSLIQKENPDLIGRETPIPPPENRTDAEAMREWLERLHEQSERAEAAAAQLPDELFPIDYHIYFINRGEDGHIEIEIEGTRGIVGINYSERHTGKWHSRRSGNIRAAVRDIYLYYGVSEEDIAAKSERYRMLVTELSAP